MAQVISLSNIYEGIEGKPRQVLEERLREPGKLIDAVILISAAREASSPESSEEEKKKALKFLETYVTDDDPIE